MGSPGSGSVKVDAKGSTRKKQHFIPGKYARAPVLKYRFFASPACNMAGNFDDTSFDSVSNYLADFDQIEVHKGRFEDTCSTVSELKISFVHFDIDLYEPTLKGLQFLDPLMRQDGLILVDDDGFKTCPGVRCAVDEFVELNHSYFRLRLLSGQVLLVKQQGLR